MRRVCCSGLAVGLLLVGCTSDPEATIAVPEAAVTTDDAGDARTEGDPVTDDSAAPGAAPPTTPPPASTVALPTTIESTSTTTEPPTTDPTTTPAPAPPTTAEPDPVGDGPVLTNPADSGGNALAPVFFNLSATPTVDCDDADTGTVSLQWEAIGTESVSIAIGSESRVFRLGEPPAGSLDAPLDCDGDETYFAIAENPDGRTVRSVTVSP